MTAGADPEARCNSDGREGRRSQPHEYRVIQWSTGNVGRHALRCIERHPDLELVGLWVHSPDKAGKDAGELAGLAPNGVLATNDVDALLALDADCVCYTATADLRPGEAMKDLERILASGKNVVSSSVVSMIYPPHVPDGMREPLEAACTSRQLVVLHVGHRSRLGERPAAVRAHRRVRVHRRGARDGGRQLRDLRAADRALRHDGFRQGARLQAACCCCPAC